MPTDGDQLGEMTDDERRRIGRVLSQIAGGHAPHYPVEGYLEVWIAEHRMRAERMATARLTRATWALMAATVVLAFATIALVIATVAHGG